MGTKGLINLHDLGPNQNGTLTTVVRLHQPKRHLLTLKRRRSQFLAFGWTETELENDWKWFLIHFLLVDLAWRVMNSIHLSLQSCKYLASHEWEVRKKKRMHNFAISMYFAPFIESKISPWKWYFLSLSPTNKTKVTYSSFYSNWNFGKIRNIEYFIGIWTLNVFLMSSLF
jgi:hypothetical protein